MKQWTESRRGQVRIKAHRGPRSVDTFGAFFRQTILFAHRITTNHCTRKLPQNYPRQYPRLRFLAVLILRVGRLRYAWGLEIRENSFYPVSFVRDGWLACTPQDLQPPAPAIVAGGSSAPSVASSIMTESSSGVTKAMKVKLKELKGKLQQARHALALAEKQKAKQQATDEYLANADQNFADMDLNDGDDTWIAPKLPEASPDDRPSFAEDNFVRECYKAMLESVQDNMSLRKRMKEFVTEWM